MTAGRKVGRHVRARSRLACKQPAYTCAAAHVEHPCSQHAVGEQEAGKGKREGGLHGCGRVVCREAAGGSEQRRWLRGCFAWL